MERGAPTSMEPEAPVTQRPPLGETERGRAPDRRASARRALLPPPVSVIPAKAGPVGAPLVGARSPSLRPLPLWRPLCNPPADWNTAGAGRSCPPLPLGEGWGEGGGWSGARRRPWSRKPRLRKGPLWGRLREGARRGVRAPGGRFSLRPYPSFPRKRESIPSRRGASRGRPLPFPPASPPLETLVLPTRGLEYSRGGEVLPPSPAGRGLG